MLPVWVGSESFSGSAKLLHKTGSPLSYLKDRGQWKSNCIYKYITPTLGDKGVLDKEFTLRKVIIWRNWANYIV